MDATVLVSVLGNDSDPNGDPLVVTAIGHPDHGVARLEADSQVRYTPNAGFEGLDRFQVRVCDPWRACVNSLLVVQVGVAAVPNAPNAHDDAVGVADELEISVDVLANDSDPDGDPLIITNVSRPSLGTVRVVDGPEGQALIYTPSGTWSGSDEFTYTITDGHTLATASVIVAGGDHDHDTLSESAELAAGTDPNGYDTDGDGLGDAEELAGGTDPRDGDSDDDGLADRAETMLGTDPTKADSDGDGIWDGVELGVTIGVDAGHSASGLVYAGTDRAVFVPDADPTHNTDARRVDSDGDGIDDGVADPNHDGRVDPTELSKAPEDGPSVPPSAVGASASAGCDAGFADSGWAFVVCALGGGVVLRRRPRRSL